MIDIIIHPSRKSRDQIPIRLLLPMYFNPRLFRLARFGKLTSPTPIRDRGIVQSGCRRVIHRLTLPWCQKVLNRMYLRSGSIDHDRHFSSTPGGIVRLGLGGIHALISASVVLPGVRHLFSDLGLEGYFFVGQFDFFGDAVLDAGGEFLEDGGGVVGAVGFGELAFGGGFAVVEEFGGGFVGDCFGVGVFYFYAFSDENNLILILIHRKMIHPTSLILPRTNPRLLRRQFPNLEHVSRERIQCKVRPV
mmetsp:Transcript_34226/g.55893  ORF Transcript_34226/g.55893 Transcript_34226/m.55893 type:complete len:248 (+) Transcript_34226:534-1277(+)